MADISNYFTAYVADDNASTIAYYYKGTLPTTTSNIPYVSKSGESGNTYTLGTFQGIILQPLQGDTGYTPTVPSSGEYQKLRLYNPDTDTDDEIKIYYIQNSPVKNKSFSLSLLPIIDSSLHLRGDMVEEFSIAENPTTTDWHTIENPNSDTVTNSFFGYRNFRFKGFTLNFGLEFEVYAIVAVVSNSLTNSIAYKCGDYYYTIDDTTNELTKISVTEENACRVNGYLKGEDFEYIYQYNNKWYSLSTNKEISTTATLVPQSVWLLPDEENSINNFVPYLKIQSGMFSKQEYYKNYTPNTEFSRAFLEIDKISDTSILNDNANIYTKFEARTTSIRYEIDANSKNVFIENINTNGLIQGGGFFEDGVQYPRTFRYGETILVPQPKRNIAVSGISGTDRDHLLWGDLSYNVYSFAGWIARRTSDSYENMEIITSESPINPKMTFNVSDEIILTPYWYKLTDDDIQSMVITRNANRTVFNEPVRISKSSNDAENFLSFDYDSTDNSYLLSGVQFGGTIGLSNQYYTVGEGGVVTLSSEPGNKQFPSQISYYLSFDDISDETLNTTAFNNISENLDILTTDVYNVRKKLFDLNAGQKYGIISHLIRIGRVANNFTTYMGSAIEKYNYSPRKEVLDSQGNTQYVFYFFNKKKSDSNEYDFFYPIVFFEKDSKGNQGYQGEDDNAYKMIIRIQTSSDSDSDISNLNIDKYPVNSLLDNWKVLLDTNKQISDVSLVSLFDLIAYEANTSDGKSYLPYLEKTKGSTQINFNADVNTKMGTKLSHDIILNNTSIYNESHSVYNSDSNSVAWKQSGIDIGLAFPDKRNRAYKLNYSEYGNDTESDLFIATQPDGGNFLLYKKDAYEKPTKVKDVYFPKEKTYADWFLLEKRTYPKDNNFLPADSQGEALSSGWFSPYVDEMFSVLEYSTDAQGTASTTIDDTASVVLSCQDTILQNSLSFGGTFNCWTRFCLNPYNSLVVRFIIAAILNLGQDVKLNNDSSLLPSLSSLNAPSSSGSSNVNAISSQLITDNWDILANKRNYLSAGSYTTSEFSEQLIKAIKSAKSDDDKLIYLLKHTFVWVRAAFAADYVNPDDFDQKLNKDSSVVHKNVLARNDRSNGEFNRYQDSLFAYGDDPNTEETRFSGYSFPYIPRNAPLKDYLTKEYLKPYTEGNSIDYTKLYKESVSEESEIGSVLSDPTNKIDGTGTVVSPLQFLDPDNVYSGAESPYREKPPTVIPKSGNIWSDSRIISPTIDELWYIIKKLISGRGKDEIIKNTIRSNGFIDDKENNRLANIFGNQYENSSSQELEEATKGYYFKIGNKTIYGDPVDYEFTTGDGVISEFKINEYFTQPDSINYVIYSNLNDVADIIKTNFVPSTDDDKSPLLTDVNIKGFKRNGTTLIYTVSKDVENNGETPEIDWLLREEAPMSLREMEGAILGNKFNIINNFRFIKENFAVNGRLGYSYTYINTNTNTSFRYAGSLYQFHKDYNFSIENPNTVYHKNGSGKAVKTNGEINTDFGYDFVDVSNIVTKESNLKYYNQNYNPNDSESNVFLTTTKGTDKLPLLVENYGEDDYTPENKNDYNGYDVYLNAMGEWKLENRISRLPILRSKY